MQIKRTLRTLAVAGALGLAGMGGFPQAASADDYVCAGAGVHEGTGQPPKEGVCVPVSEDWWITCFTAEYDDYDYETGEGYYAWAEVCFPADHAWI